MIGVGGRKEQQRAGAVESEAEQHGGHLEPLADGSIIVTIAGERRVATDLAVQAARCALALRALCPERRMALSMGRTEVTGTMPTGDAIDRAAQMLTKGTLGSDSTWRFAKPAGEYFVRLEDGGEHSAEVDHTDVKP